MILMYFPFSPSTFLIVRIPAPLRMNDAKTISISWNIIPSFIEFCSGSETQQFSLWIMLRFLERRNLDLYNSSPRIIFTALLQGTHLYYYELYVKISSSIVILVQQFTCSTPNCKSLVSFSDTAGKSTIVPGKLMPFLLPNIPPFSTVHTTLLSSERLTRNIEPNSLFFK